MIDKQEFDNFFKEFDKSVIIEIIDEFVKQQPEIIGLLEQSFADYNLVQIMVWSHKFRTTCGLFRDPVSTKHLQLMEEAANRKIIEVVDILIHDYPDSLKKIRQELDEEDLIRKNIVPVHSLKAFFAGFFDSFSTENAMKLEDLEKMIIADGMPQMLTDLKTSSGELLQELLLIKKKLIS